MFLAGNLAPAISQRLCLFSLSGDTIGVRFLQLDLEAYVKALGRGFSAAPFNTFTIRFRPTSNSGLHHVNGDSDSQASEIVVEAFEDPKNLTNNWQFTLFELARTHYAAICKEKDNIFNGEVTDKMRLKVWRTIPFVEDECVCGTEAVKIICGLT
ncbi:uncharacterized protein LOC122059032 [Macadamia integrifolia]|uniref:uncharacterized protein LOC122059032 n=1 Tax=Macadamia integrifolia TaxID=60698 RepID=UPI001C5319A5|nr:uncharacterized protein LOC122059032 [Macadamia integrifolia]